MSLRAYMSRLGLVQRDLPCVVLLLLLLSYLTYFRLEGSLTLRTRAYQFFPSTKCSNVVIKWKPLGVEITDDVIAKQRQSLYRELTQMKVDRYDVLQQLANRLLVKGEGQKNRSRSRSFVGAPRRVEEEELCPVRAQDLDLVGEMTCACNASTPQQVMDRWPGLMKSGRLEPKGCVARSRVAIIIPYKDRYGHLHTLLDGLIPLLVRQKVDATFFVIEQEFPDAFNRGTLHNVGYLWSSARENFDCFIFHDVDLVPLDDHIMYRCGTSPRHLAVAIKRYGMRRAKKMYSIYFGGIVAFTRDQYEQVNGNANTYFGWGGEDDDMYERVKNSGYTRYREDDKVYRFQMLKHERNDRSRGNRDRILMLKKAKQRQDEDGLQTTKFKVNSVEVMPLYIWVKVSIDVKVIIKTAPKFAVPALEGVLSDPANNEEKRI